MRITGEGICGPPANIQEAIATLRRALELGINLIDTADAYGPEVSELLIAEALYPYPKDLVIATKGGFVRPGPFQWVPDGRPQHLREALEGSLRRLRLDHIDIYQLHCPDPEVPFEVSVSELAKMREVGRRDLDSGGVWPGRMRPLCRCKRCGLIAGLVHPHRIEVGWEADEVPCRSFSDFLPPNWTCAFQRIQLSSIAALPSIRGFCVPQLDLLSSHRMPVLDVHVTRSTEDQGLAFPCCHHLYPSGFLSPGILFQVFERQDVVNLDFVGERCCSALLTDLGEQSFFEFGSLAPYLLLGLVLKGCFHIPGERDTAPGGNERVLALSGYDHLKALVLDPIHIQFGAVLVVHLRHRQFVFVRQRLCQRCVHDPFQVLEGMQIVGQSVVIDDATIFQLVGRQDRVITLVGQFGAMNHFAFALVPIAFFLEDVMRHPESNLSIDASAHGPFVAAALGVVLDGGHFVSQESCRLGPGVGDERLCFREFQFQLVAQKRGELLLDLFCLRLWTDESQKKVG